MKRVLRREFVFFISVNAGWKSTVGLCSPILFPATVFCLAFFFFSIFANLLFLFLFFSPQQQKASCLSSFLSCLRGGWLPSLCALGV